ncbi:GNAT family N-acetyltransferase [Streptomyces griseoaurantiacus]|uniref:GNAT family N-acetyltransferase n=1 Tax=Streptomyces griseoaurantiacus TaxID=68213 RepID=UPI0034611ECE
MTVKSIDELAPQLANCRAYWLSWGAEGRGEDDLTYYRSGVAHAQLNAVIRLRDADRAEEALARAGLELAGVPWMWWVAPDSAPGTGERLLGHGFERVGAMPVMAVSLDRVSEVPAPPGVEIEVLEGDDPGTCAAWVRAYGPSFGVGPELVDTVVGLEQEWARDPRAVRFLARQDGRAVGTSLLFDAHGVAGVYLVATAEEHRRRGIGAALTAAALEEGRRRGLHVGTLQASGLGAPVYARMGFETVAEYELYRPPASRK